MSAIQEERLRIKDIIKTVIIGEANMGRIKPYSRCEQLIQRLSFKIDNPDYESQIDREEPKKEVSCKGCNELILRRKSENKYCHVCQCKNKRMKKKRANALGSKNQE